MRKLLAGLVIVLLLLVAVPAAFLFVPSPMQKWAVERIASVALGRQVTSSGPFHLRAWPPLAITATDVRIANADWSTAPELARIEALEVSADLLAYRSGNLVKIDRLLLLRPQVHLEVAADGRRNWAFGDGTPDNEAVAEPASPREIPGLVLGDIRVEDGLITYDDRAGGLSRRVEDVDLGITQAGADQPVGIDGGLVMEGQRANLAGTVAQASALAAGESSPTTLELGLPGGTVTFDGTLNSAGPTMNGRTTIDLTAPRELLAWLGQEPALPEPALRAASLAAQLDLTAERVVLEQLELRQGEITGTGRVVATMGEPPTIAGELAFNNLNLDPYLPRTPGDAEPPAAGEQAPAPAGGWSEEPIELPLPLPVDLDFRLRAQGFQVLQLEMGRLAGQIQANRQRALLTIEELQAYGGQLQGTAQAQPGARPAYALALQSQGVRLLPVLRALTGRERFDGAAELDLDLTASGGSQRDLVGSLDGAGRVVLRDGAVLGINIAAIIRQVMTLGLNPAAGREQRTDFAEAGGSFRIEDGVVRNDDLMLGAPVLRLEGGGTVDLPQRTLDYRIRPQVALTLEGQDSSGESKLQAGVPFLVQGPLEAPSVRFDLNGTLTGAIDSPEDVARIAADLARNPQAVRALRDQFNLLERLPDTGRARELLEGVLGGGGGGQRKGQPAERPPSLEDAARGLLQGLGR